MRILYLHGSWMSFEDGQVTVSVRGKLQAAAGKSLADQFDLLVLNTGLLWGKDADSYAEIFKKELVRRGVKPEKILILDNGHPKALDTSVEIESLARETKKHPDWKFVTEVAFADHLKTIDLIYDKLELPKPEFRSTESIISKLGTKKDKDLLRFLKNSPEEKMFQLYEKLNLFAINIFGGKMLRNFTGYRNHPGPNVPWYLKLIFSTDVDIFQLPKEAK